MKIKKDVDVTNFLRNFGKYLEIFGNKRGTINSGIQIYDQMFWV